ncbi:hypothetical protein ABIA95_000220 [Bradyrhizobium sp. LA8.1]|uniref:hypothetical protein n=1 Tax=unclassified Bradyrhizobium TaxID=2631580 RepID=UPI0033910AED
MPTGYTYPVVEGKVTEFPEFAMLCARAFGALIMMRDDSMDAPIPDEFTPDTSYYDGRIATDMAQMGNVQAMSRAEADAAAAAEHAAAMESRRKYLEDKEVEAGRINAMLSKVRAWEPPTPDHAEMKAFMIEQLRISMPGDYVPSIPELLDGRTWRQNMIDQLAKTVARNREEVQKEIERAKGRTEWVKALRTSLLSSQLLGGEK